MTVAIISGAFSAVVATLLIANYVQIRFAAPLDSPGLIELRQEIIKSPAATPELVEQIETLDLLARKAYLTSQGHIRTGAWLLLGGAVVFLAALRLAATFKPRVPSPEAGVARDDFWRVRARARRLIEGAGIGFVALAVLAALFTDLRIPSSSPAPTRFIAPTPRVTPPDWEAVEQNWPSFRGPGSYGVARHTTAPSDWDGASGKNIKWKVEIPLPGRNSPVVWGNRVFLTGATESQRELFAFDADTGQIVWRFMGDGVPGAPPPQLAEDTGYAPSTMVAHGSQVFAIFPTGDVVACGHDGNVFWQKNLGLPDNHYGHSSSLLAYGDLLLVQYDQMKKGKLIALDVYDGHEVWSAPRQYISWASPACIPSAQGPQLILNSEKNVDSYDPVSGKLLWQVKCLDGEVAPSPAYGGGRIFVANEYAMATALTLGGTPEAPTAAAAWEWDEALPDVSSPVGDGTYFYVATSMGYVVCLDAASGKMVWQHEFDEGFYSSPIVVGDRVFVGDKAGVTHVFKTGPEFVLVGDSALGEPIFATPAFLDKRIYIRTEGHLWCVAAEDDG
ncbi:MAG: PQQ-binding-like beta-propeller repeat protein [Candidatus Hydrogenedentes bacterium]|nr:PQQ-binding-like beta-propeller repeat protein [Candidatus Hydrogenedentota bacterium]